MVVLIVEDVPGPALIDSTAGYFAVYGIDQPIVPLEPTTQSFGLWQVRLPHGQTIYTDREKSTVSSFILCDPFTTRGTPRCSHRFVWSELRITLQYDRSKLGEWRLLEASVGKLLEAAVRRHLPRSIIENGHRRVSVGSVSFLLPQNLRVTAESLGDQPGQLSVDLTLSGAEVKEISPALAGNDPLILRADHIPLDARLKVELQSLMAGNSELEEAESELTGLTKLVAKGPSARPPLYLHEQDGKPLRFIHCPHLYISRDPLCSHWFQDETFTYRLMYRASSTSYWSDIESQVRRLLSKWKQ